MQDFSKQFVGKLYLHLCSVVVIQKPISAKGSYVMVQQCVTQRARAFCVLSPEMFNAAGISGKTTFLPVPIAGLGGQTLQSA